MATSQSLLLRLAAVASGFVPISFGINAILRPEHALTVFEPFAGQYPTDPSARQVVDALMIIYGARNILFGSAILAPLYFGSRKTAGAMLIAGSAVAGVDGWVCRRAGGGEWAHWGYVPALVVLGGLLMRG